jgi:uncharacterized protein YkwD
MAVLGVACGAPRVTAGREPTTSHASVAAGTLEQAVHELVNRHRRARHLPTLTLDPRISQAAWRHSVAMAAGTTPFGHDGFEARANALRQVMASQRTAENVASNRGYRDAAAEAVRGWLGSSGHRRNIEGPYERTGVGVARSATGEVFFTQIFVGR